MNNKGFTLVELLVSFVLSMVLIILMFQLIINLKEVYLTSGIKTELLNKQNLMSNKIYSDLTEKNLTAISYCGAECIVFTFNGNIRKMLYIDVDSNIINYDNYVIKLNNNSQFSNISFENIEVNSSKKNRILSINIPITNSLFKNDNFGVNIVYPYNDTELANTENYNYKINGITVASSNSTPTMENPVTYTGLGKTGNIYIKQGEVTLGKINMQGHDPLMCIEGICDYIDYENSNIVRNIGKYVLTGNENWQLRNSDTTNGIYTYSITKSSWILSNINYKYYSNIKALNNYLEYSETVTGVAEMFSSSKKFTLYYQKTLPNDRAIYLNTSFSTLNSFKSTLQSLSNNGEPMIIYYELAEPLYESLSLPSINTFTDISTLTITDGTISSTIE